MIAASSILFSSLWMQLNLPHRARKHISFTLLWSTKRPDWCYYGEQPAERWFPRQWDVETGEQTLMSWGFVCMSPPAAKFLLKASECVQCTPGMETVPSRSRQGCARALSWLFCSSPESSRSVFLPLFDQADRRALFQAACSNPCQWAPLAQ